MIKHLFSTPLPLTPNLWLWRPFWLIKLCRNNHPMPSHAYSNAAYPDKLSIAKYNQNLFSFAMFWFSRNLHRSRWHIQANATVATISEMIAQHQSCRNGGSSSSWRYVREQWDFNIGSCVNQRRYISSVESWKSILKRVMCKISRHVGRNMGAQMWQKILLTRMQTDQPHHKLIIIVSPSLWEFLTNRLLYR